MLRLKKLALRAPWSVLAFGLLLTTSDRMVAQDTPGHGDVYSLLANQPGLTTQPVANQPGLSIQTESVLAGHTEHGAFRSPTRALPNPFRLHSESANAAYPAALVTSNQALTSPVAEIDLGTVLAEALSIEKFEVTTAVAVSADGVLSDENILRVSTHDEQEPQTFSVAGAQPQLLGPAPSDGQLVVVEPQPLASVASEVDCLSSGSQDSQGLDLADLYGAELNGAVISPVTPNESEVAEATGPEVAVAPMPQCGEVEASSGNEVAPTGRFSDDDLYALAMGLENAGYTPDAHHTSGEVIGVLPVTMKWEAASPRLPRLVPIQEIFVDVAPRQVELGEKKSETGLPENLASEQFGPYSAAVVGANEDVRYAPMQYLWASPASRHKPLYFEQPNLERYGTHAGGTCLASAGATGRFVGDALTLPYQLGVHAPSECIYTLGAYRPGNCTPHYFHVSPLSPKGLLYQGAVVTGLVFFIP